MSNKKIISILALFLVMFIAVGAVSAADDIAVSDVNDGSDISVNVLNGVKTNGTFADLQGIINSKNAGDTIELDKDYVYTDDSEDVYGIVIDKALTIDGKGFILDGKATSRIFYVNSSGVTFKNINFVNGFTAMPGEYGAYYQGAGILFYGAIADCTVENCNFTNMVADTYSAISFDQGANGNVINCQFTDCKATKGAAGAIGFGYKAGGSSLVKDSTFDNCGSASGTKGGAITFASLDYGAGEISSCDFIDCYSGTGGAVSFSAGGAKVSECTFTDCKATDTFGTGGAIYSKKNGISIESCKFVDCTANNGAALYFDNSKNNEIDECVFVSDVTTGSLIASGTINMENCIFDTVEGVKLVTSSGNATNSFWNDKGPVKGTDYQNINVKNYVTLEITGTDDNINFAFKSNDSSDVDMPDYAVTVEVIAGEETISQPVIISGNTGSYELPERCDKVIVKTAEGNELEEFGPEIVYISATGSDANPGTEDDPVATLEKALNLVVKDGSIVFLGEGTFVLNDVVIDKTVTISSADGAVLSGDNLGRILNITADDVVIEGLTFINGKSAVAGGAIYVTGANLKITNCTFNNNTANGAKTFGGAIFVDGENAVIDKCTFLANAAGTNWADQEDTYGGGSIYINAPGCTVSNSKFSSNGRTTSIRNGGAISVNAANVKVSDCEFSDITGALFAGGVCVRDNGNGFEITNCKFTNVNGNNGGAMTIHASSTVNNCTFDNCSAYFGNAILAGIGYHGQDTDFDYLTLNDCTFTNCYTVDNSGSISNGALDIQDNAVKAVISGNTLFENCSVVDNSGWGTGGGAIYSKSDVTIEGTLRIVNCYCTEGKSKNGGAIVNRGTMVVKGDLIIENCAAENGGAIYTKYHEDEDGVFPGIFIVAETGSLTVKDCNATNGGAVYVTEGASFTVNGEATFTGNKATNGGAIYSLGTLTITGSEFTDNTLDLAEGEYGSGGVIYTTGKLTIDDCLFANNCPNTEYVNNKGQTELKYVNGGVICAESAEVSISNSVFDNNTGRWGAACLFDGGKTQVSNCEFKSNNVYNGAIYTYNDETTLTDCKFVNNEAKYVGSKGCSASGADIIGYGADSIVNVENCKFDQSSATSATAGAGSIHIQEGSIINIKDSTFTGIKSSGDRGAIHVIRASANLNNVILDGCTSNGAAAISINAGTVNADNCKFTNNVGKSAGVISASNNAVLTVKKSIFDSNIAANGAIVIIDSSVAVFDADNFTNNHAKNGVVISATNKTGDEVQLTVINSEFINNDDVIPYANGFANDIEVNAVVETGVDSVIAGNKFESNSNKAILENKAGATTDVSGEANTVKDNGGAEGNDGYILNNGNIIGAIAVLDTPVIAVQKTETGTTETVIGFKGHIETENGGTLVYQPSTVEATLECEEQAQDYTLPLKSTVETDEDFANYMLTTNQFDASKGIPVLKDKMTVSNLEDAGKVFITNSPDGSLSQLVEVINLYNEGAKDTPFALDKDYAYNASCDSELFEGIAITQSIAINGNGFTIDGGNVLTNLFIVNDGVSLGLSNVELTGVTGAPIDMTAGNNAIVLDTVTYEGSNAFVDLSATSTVTAKDCVAPNSYITYVTGATINSVVVIGAVEDANEVYNLTATVTVGGIAVDGLGFKFTATYVDGSTEPIADAAAKADAHGVYYLDGTEFAGKIGKIIVGVDLANADVTTATVNRVPSIMVEKNYNVTRGDIVYVVVIVDGKVSDNAVGLWDLKHDSIGVLNSTELKDGKYYYTFKVDTTNYATKEIGLSARLSTVDEFGELIDVAVDSTKEIFLNDPVPVLSNVTVTGNYSDKVNITFTVINGNIGDQIVLHLLNGQNMSRSLLNGKNVTFTNIELPFAGIFNTDVLYMRGTEVLTTAQVNWNIAKIDSSVNFNVTDITSKPGVEETVLITVTDANGKAVKQGNITVSGEGITLDKTVYELDANGQATVSFKCTAVGEYSLNVAYTGGVLSNNTDNYNPSDETLAIEIINATVTVTVTDTTPSGKVNDTITITGTVVDEFGNTPEGNVTITVNGVPFTAVVGEDGSFSLEVNATESGKWTDTVKFISGDVTVWDNAESEDVTVSVRKLHTYIVSEYDGEGAFISKYSQIKELNFTVYDENDNPVNGGLLTIWLNGVAYDFTVGADGKVSAQDDAFVWLSTGLYNYVVDYTNTGKVYYDSFNFTNVNVPKVATNIVIDKNVTESTVSGGKVTITFTVSSVDGDVSVTKGYIYYVTPDGVEHSVDVVDGVATVTIDVTRTGTYYIAASYVDLDGDFLYSEADFTWDVQLTRTLITVSNSADGLVATIKVADENGNSANGNLMLFVNGKQLDLTVVNGVATVGLGAYNGPVELNAVFTGADGFTSSDVVVVELADIPVNAPAHEETVPEEIATSESRVPSFNPLNSTGDEATPNDVDDVDDTDSASEDSAAEETDVSTGIPMQSTAIPIFALLLALLAIPFAYRRD